MQNTSAWLGIEGKNGVDDDYPAPGPPGAVRTRLFVADSSEAASGGGDFRGPLPGGGQSSSLSVWMLASWPASFFWTYLRIHVSKLLPAAVSRPVKLSVAMSL